MMKFRKGVLVFQDFENKESSAQEKITSQKVFNRPDHMINFMLNSHDPHQKKDTNVDLQLWNFTTL